MADPSHHHLQDPEESKPWTFYVYPDLGADWLPPHRGRYTDEDRRRILELIHFFNSTLTEIREWVVHQPISEDDTYGGLMDWEASYSDRARIWKIMESQYEPDMDNPRDARFRHILYSVIDPMNTEDKLVLITLRTIRNRVVLIAASEHPYFLFRAMATGIWESSWGMHIFLRASSDVWARGDIAWFHRHMRQYTVSLLDMLVQNMRWWANYIHPPPDPELESGVHLEEDWYPPMGGTKNTLENV
jgi:hypothetical protein